MLQIENLSNDPHQQHTLIVADGEIGLELRYLATVQQWHAWVEWKGRRIGGVKLSGGSFHFRAFNLPFDIACQVTDATGLDPFRVDDFSGGRCLLYLVTRAEMAEIRGADVP